MPHNPPRFFSQSIFTGLRSYARQHSRLAIPVLLLPWLPSTFLSITFLHPILIVSFIPEQVFQPTTCFPALHTHILHTPSLTSSPTLRCQHLTCASALLSLSHAVSTSRMLLPYSLIRKLSARHARFSSVLFVTCLHWPMLTTPCTDLRSPPPACYHPCFFLSQVYAHLMLPILTLSPMLAPTLSCSQSSRSSHTPNPHAHLMLPILHIGLARTKYIFTYKLYFWQGNHQVYGHVRCIYGSGQGWVIYGTSETFNTVKYAKKYAIRV